MINPYQITNFERTEEELQEFWLFCICVAGKTAYIIAKMLDNFLQGEKPFEAINKMITDGTLLENLKKARLGKYRVLEKAFPQSLKLDLRKCTVDELENIIGVGPKTARFFLLHSRKDVQISVIDTHMLKYIQSLGHNVPQTLTKKKYLEFEKIIIEEANKSKMSLADFDLMIWKKYAKREK